MYMPFTGTEPGTFQSADQRSTAEPNQFRQDSIISYFKVGAQWAGEYQLLIKPPCSQNPFGSVVERWSADWKVPGSIPVKGMYIGCR